MSRPTDQLARPGDIVRLEGFWKRPQPNDAPGLVLALDDSWAHVQWSDNAPHVDRFDASTWTQWHPIKVLSVISTT
jgi:hypothetical protein